MHVEFDRDTCIGMYQCVDEWAAFEENRDAGKADLAESEETDPELFVREVPDFPEGFVIGKLPSFDPALALSVGVQRKSVFLRDGRPE